MKEKRITEVIKKLEERYGVSISVENGALSINGFTSSCYVVRNRSGDVIIRSFDVEYIKEVLHWAVDEKHNPGLDITE